MRASIAVLALAPMLYGCSQTRVWRYEPVSTPSPEHSTHSARVSVLPFADERGDESVQAGFLVILPVIGVVGPMMRERPEGHAMYAHAAGYQATPPHDIARAVAAELNAGAVVEEAFFTEREREPEIDYVLRGSLQEFTYDGYLIGYTGFIGCYLWILGLPTAHVKNRVRMSLEMTDPEGNVVWSGSEFSGEEGTTTGFYYNSDEEFARFPELVQEASALWVAELREFFAAQPEAAPPEAIGQSFSNSSRP